MSAFSAMLAVFTLVTAGNALADGWQSRAPVPGARAAHSIVWTGSEAIAWGGGVDGSFLNTGARYSPVADSWRVTSPYGAPAPRWFHAAVWTGSEMIVWGGRANFFPGNHFNDGARYNPTTDTWTSISSYGAPTPRSQCAAVWTGEEMIVWGGETDGGTMLADGAAYNPATDSWRPIGGSGLTPRMEPTAVWTGSEMIVFGGVDATQPGWLSYGDGARYNPFTDSWTPLPAGGAPGSRTGHTAVWTGERMIVWGGRELPSDARLNDGASYHPGSDTWSTLSPYGAPQARALHAAVWTGSEMIVWGGDYNSALLNTGARYNPATSLWTPMTQSAAPRQRMFWRPDHGIWTGRGMVVCAGSDYPASLDSTALYTTFDLPCPPVIVEQPQSVTVTEGQPVTLAVGARGCVLGEVPTASASSLVPGSDRFTFETGARSGQLLLDLDFYTLPDSIRVYYEGQLIFDTTSTGHGQFLVSFGPGNATSVEIVMNEETGALPASVWEYTVRYRPPQVSFQWHKNGSAIEGQTNEILRFESVRLADAGDYTVLVSGNGGSVLSAVATVTVEPVQPTNCIPPGLVAWWRGNGNAKDVTGAHNGELLYGTTFVPGVAGQAFTFDLSRARVSIPDSDAFKLTNSLSFEGWINVSSYAPGIVFIRGDNRGGLDPYHMSVQPSGQLHWGINTVDNNFAFVQSPGPVPTGVWMHVAAVLDGATGNMGLYINGSLVGQTNTTLRPLRDLDPNWEPAVGIGNAGGTFHHFPFHGSVDEWALYSRALGAAEVLALYNRRGVEKCGTNLPPATNHVFNLADGFTLAANPSGPWSYGHLTGSPSGNFELLNTTKSFGAENGVPISVWFLNDNKPFVAKVMGPGTAVSYLFQAPQGTVYFGANPDASNDFAAIRFTVPAGAGGLYRLSTQVRALYDASWSADSDFHVLRNGVGLLSRLVPANSSSSYSNVLALAAGDRVDFVSGRGSGLPETGLKIQAAMELLDRNAVGVERVAAMPEGGVRVTGFAPVGTFCRVERSSNLRDWTYAGQAVEKGGGVFEFTDPQPPAGTACFYRMLKSGQ